jgi:hypothetical protein
MEMAAFRFLVIRYYCCGNSSIMSPETGSGLSGNETTRVIFRAKKNSLVISELIIRRNFLCKEKLYVIRNVSPELC